MLRFITLLLFTTIFCTPAALQAAFTDDVARDFSPVSTYLVMPVGTEWIVDAGAGTGVVTGDIFTLVRPGQKIIHPVTKEILGSLDEVRAILKVTRIKSEYSYAAVLEGGKDLAAGEKALRYQGTPAVFWDYTGEGETLFLTLSKTLTQFDWTPYAAAQSDRPEKPAPLDDKGTSLLFILDDSGLTVRDSAFHAIRTYPRIEIASFLPATVSPPSQLPTTPPPPALPVSPAPGIVVTPPPPSSNGTAIVKAAIPSMEGVWRSQKMAGKPVGIEIADLDGDGALETAVCFNDRIEVGRVSGDAIQVLGRFEIPPSLKPLSIDGADLDGDGRMNLYVTAARGMALSSFAVDFSQGKFKTIYENVPWFFRSVTLPGEGRILLAQKIGENQNDFIGPVFRVGRSGEELTEGKSIELPPYVILYGFTLFEGPQGKTFTASLTGGDTLQVIDNENNVLWESGSDYGGLETSMERPEQAVGPDKRYLFLKARIETLADATILVPVNEGNRMTAIRTFRKSRLVSLKWDGYSLVETWHTAPQQGYMADFRVADADNDGVDEIVQIVAFGRKGFFTKGEESSSVLIYEMQ